MKNNLRNIFLASIGALTIGVAMLSLSGCNDPTPGPATGCAAHNNDKTTCVATTGANGKMCEYKDATNECVEGTVAPVVCKDLTPDNCKASKVCTFKENENPPVCEDADAAVKNTCKAYQSDTSCTADTTCDWDAAKKECDVKGGSSGTIYTWKEMSLPGNAEIADITKFAVSGDNNHIYLFSNKAGEKGLYYSGNGGDSWEALNTISGTPAANADIANLNTRTGIDKITPTSIGAVVTQGKVLGILTGKTCSYAIDAGKHHKNQKGADKSPLSNLAISFVDVASTSDGETVIFGQDIHAEIFLHSATKDFTEMISMLEIKLFSKTSNLNQKWLAVGNSPNGDLLLASAAGVWVLPPTGVNKVINDNAVIALDNAGPWKLGNSNVLSVGALGAGGTLRYFVGLKRTGPNTGGIVFGPFPPPNPNPVTLDLLGTSVMGVTKFANKTYLRTTAGLIGVDDNGTVNRANDYKLDTFATDKKEMKADKTAAPLGAADNAALDSIYGDDDKSFYVVPSKGIYIRTKGTGRPRP